jgi:hypothetical protein
MGRVEGRHEKAADQYEEGCPGWMRDLQFIGTGSEFATVPEAARSFHCHDIYCGSNNKDDPSGNVVDAFKIHIDLGYRSANIKLVWGMLLTVNGFL